MNNLLASINPGGHYRILFLGSTGAGKSTAINSFVNYSKFGTFEEAEKGDLVSLIPITVRLPNPKNAEEQMTYFYGDPDSNEQLIDNKSHTCALKQYEIVLPNSTRFTFIDTPGLCDTAGVEVDTFNVDKLFSFLGELPELHAVCVVIKANDSRLTAEFCYSVGHSLVNFHKTVFPNVVVLCTNATSTGFSPGPGYYALKNFFDEELGEEALPLRNGINTYFVDNSSLSYMVALKNHHPIEEARRTQHRICWNKSATACIQLLAHVSRLEPHSIHLSTAVYQAKRLTVAIAEPYVRLQNLIAENEALLKKWESPPSQDLIAHARAIQEVKVLTMSVAKLDHPRTVCTALKCITAEVADGLLKVNYAQHCHPHCFLTDVDANTIGHPGLINCAAMDEDYCRECRCPWQLHMHIFYEFVSAFEPIVGQASTQSVSNISEAQVIIETMTRRMEETSSEYSKERSELEKYYSILGGIVEDNAVQFKTDFLNPYIDLLVREEEAMRKEDPTRPESKLKSLQDMKKHREQVKELLQTAESAAGVAQDPQQFTLANFASIRGSLFQLKYSGAIFLQVLRQSTDEDARASYKFLNSQTYTFP